MVALQGFKNGCWIRKVTNKYFHTNNSRNHIIEAINWPLNYTLLGLLRILWFYHLSISQHATKCNMNLINLATTCFFCVHNARWKLKLYCSLWRMWNKVSVSVQEQNIIGVHHPDMLLLHCQNFIPGYLWFCNNSQTLNLSTSATWTTILEPRPKISPLEKLCKIVPLVWKHLVNVLWKSHSQELTNKLKI